MAFQKSTIALMVTIFGLMITTQAFAGEPTLRCNGLYRITEDGGKDSEEIKRISFKLKQSKGTIKKVKDDYWIILSAEHVASIEYDISADENGPLISISLKDADGDEFEYLEGYHELKIPRTVYSDGDGNEFVLTLACSTLG